MQRLSLRAHKFSYAASKSMRIAYAFTNSSKLNPKKDRLTKPGQALGELPTGTLCCW